MMYPLLEELTLNAWPSLESMLFDGWVLNFADGVTRRANSVNPVYPSSLPLEDKIATCEALYTRRGREPVFKIGSPTVPAELDSTLARLGFEALAPTSVQVADLSEFASSADPGVQITTALDDAWLDDQLALTLTPDRFRPTIAAMLGKIVPPHAFAVVRRDSAPIALGMAIAERGFVGIFDVVVAYHARNQGLGRRLMNALLHWGQSEAAARAYLAVMCDNPPALHLYASLGFREVYQYWYRARPRAPKQ